MLAYISLEHVARNYALTKWVVSRLRFCQDYLMILLIETDTYR